jgi:4-phosphopantoate--beta-alanine ligase
MNAEIPKSHPRYESLMARRLMTDAAAEGMLAASALIAHGRGEAFDYLLAEETSSPAKEARRRAATKLLAADNPVICVNGNTVALAGTELLQCAAIIGCPIEINIYYRTIDRIHALENSLRSKQKEILSTECPQEWGMSGDEWRNAIESVSILGAGGDAKIPGLEGPRAQCHEQGILCADLLLIPLEDGDRCEALVEMGKEVIVIDLNPLSRTAQRASLTIVDELRRVARGLVVDLLQIRFRGGFVTGDSLSELSEAALLEASLEAILSGFEKLAEGVASRPR